MARYQVILAYDGTGFSGYQRQGNTRTVQRVVEEGLRQVGWQGTALLAAGRTDAGVHASGLVIAFDLDWKHSPLALQAALNAHLPPDVSIQVLREIQPDFHPRYDAVARCYRYSLYCQQQRDPLRERYAWRLWPEPHFELLQQSASLLLGTHDFAAFGTPPRTGGSTVRTVFEAQWQAEGDALWFDVTANAFLYRMVRRMVNLQVKIGKGWLPVETVTELFSTRKVEASLGLAPPQGLNLMHVIYTAEDKGFTAVMSEKKPGN